jgi:tRNA (guanine-N7-)-methyltransferase
MVAQRRADLRVVLADILPDESRFTWEVGSGHGHFLAAYSKAHPDISCVGVDITSDRIVRANRKRERGRLKNLHFVRAEADDFLAAMPGGARFTSIFILFPDPWPKRRHHKNRVVTQAFLATVAGKSEKGAGLYFRTDHKPYFDAVLSLIGAHPDWEKSDTATWPFEEESVFQRRAPRHFSLVAARR